LNRSQFQLYCRTEYAAGQGASHDSDLLTGGKGDKRIILLNGKPIGAVNRVSTGSEFRNNMAAGGTVVKTEITEQEQIILPK